MDLIKDGIRIINDSIGSKPDGILVQYVPVEEGMRDWHFDTVLLNEAQYVKRAVGKYNAMLRLFVRQSHLGLRYAHQQQPARPRITSYPLLAYIRH